MLENKKQKKNSKLAKTIQKIRNDNQKERNKSYSYLIQHHNNNNENNNNNK